MENMNFTDREAMTDLIRTDPETFFGMLDEIKADEASREVTKLEVPIESNNESTLTQPSAQTRHKAMRINFRR